MHCQQAELALNALIDGEAIDNDLTVSGREQLDAHLAGCAECRAVAETIRAQDAALRQAFAPQRQEATAIAERVARQLPFEASPARSSVRSIDWRRRSIAWGQLLLAAAAGFLLAIVVFRPWQTRHMPVPQAGVQQKHPLQARDGERRRAAPAVAHLSVATGPVEMRSPSTATWHVMPAAGAVEAGARVRTPAMSLCEFRCPDGSEIRLNSEAELVFVDRGKLQLTSGQLWSTSPDGQESHEIAVPAAAVTVRGAGAQFELSCPTDEAVLTVAQGSAEVNGRDVSQTVEPGEQARMAGGRIVDRRQVQNLVAATRWVHEVLLLKGRDNPELALRVNQLLAELGQTKMSYLCEEEIRSLGDHCVTPLTCYVQSPLSRDEPDKRAAAARILSDIAQPRSIPDLMELLADPDAAVRGCAASALTRLTGHDQGRTAEEWRSQPWESCLDTYNSWREWWLKNKERFPGVPDRVPEKKFPEQ